MMQQISRPDPLMPAHAYKTYSIVVPESTHFRKATCAEVDCQHYVNGWRVRVEGLAPEMVHAAKTSGRRFVERNVADGETWLEFEAGQPCFRADEHRARLDKPELFLVRDGDHRGNPRGTPVRRHARPGDWVEDFAEHQQAIADAHQEG